MPIEKILFTQMGLFLYQSIGHAFGPVSSIVMEYNYN
jgi:hypothetical protein